MGGEGRRRGGEEERRRRGEIRFLCVSRHITPFLPARMSNLPRPQEDNT